MKHKNQTMNEAKLAASFRDPSGFLFKRGDKLYRQINQSYQADFDLLNSSGLYEVLVSKGWLVAHEEVGAHPGRFTDLPRQARGYVEAIERMIGVRITRLSVGPHRDQTIDRTDG